MLRRIYANGFRSLSNFELRIEPGLNILVGPNGSGKSNILRFFEFVKDLESLSLQESVSRAGGAGAIFAKIDDYKISEKISFQIDGYGGYTPDFVIDDSQPQPVFITYSYEAEIDLFREKNAIAFASEAMKFYVTKEHHNVCSTEIDEWTAIYRRSNSKTISRDAEHMERHLWFMEPDDREMFVRDPTDLSFIEGMTQYSLSYILSKFLTVVAEKYSQDLANGQVFNIVPSKVREPEDVARQPVINSDGSGLAATLLALKGRVSGLEFRHYRPRRFALGGFAEIKEQFMIVNSSLEDLDVENDNFENKIKMTVKVSGTHGSIRMPFNFMSDGTVKWLVLVTAVITTSSFFCLEEPENFIHPKLQSDTADFMRTYCQQDEELFALITTHSQTFLDAVRPEELVLINMENGVTMCQRLDDPELISSEIRRTGFGLGYYYITDTF